MVEINSEFFKGLEKSKAPPDDKDPVKCTHVKFLKEMYFEQDPNTGDQVQVIKCSNCGYRY